MSETIDVAVLRVFTNVNGEFGNKLGIVESLASSLGREQEIAASLGFSETVFIDGVDDLEGHARIRIFTPDVELPFAGHPSVGTAWWLARQGTPVTALREKAGEVLVTADPDSDLMWITAHADWAPTPEVTEMASVADVEDTNADQFTDGHHYVYAWLDEPAGHLRSRMFAPELGIREDEATGADAVRMTERLGRDLWITQGEGSVLLTVLEPEGRIRVGGRTVFDSRVRLELA